ncbi:MAG: (d)CMP kinase [Planctomycetes bacterium]|nr:(d)CMP kinase [Planctomycetota bacterium]
MSARPGVIVTMDGPAGTGKSSVAWNLAQRLGLEVLDTGAMYRAAAVVAIDEGVAADDGAALAARIAEEGLAFDWSSRPPRMLLGGRDLTERIRDADVNVVVSVVARQAALRAALVEAQRVIGRAHPRLVTEGRDQGSVVFPDAQVRLYLDAHPEVRARRRVEQMRSQGRPADYEAVLRAIQQRDHLDETRTDGPLVCPQGAVRVDTSGLSLDQVVGELERIVRASVPAERLAPPRAAQPA